MDAENVLAAARAHTGGLADVGDPAVLEGLEVLLKSYESEAKFTDTGKQRQIAKVVNNMATRLKVVDWLKRNPELLEQPVEKPMFVFGLPRTGTTLTINLLHADPGRRSLLHWEAFDPVPPPRAEELYAGPRYEKSQAQTEAALNAVPHIAAIHHEGAGSPTECQFAMTPSFCAQVYEAESDIPSYRHWFLHEASYLPAFRFEKQLLQLLQSQAPGRWTLKNPWHPLYLDDLTTVFPDAQLVMTHRDPAAVVGSCCSLIKYVRQIYSDDVDLRAIGETFMDTFAIMIDRALAYKAKHGADAIHDIQYADMVRDPIAELRKVYERFGEPFTPAIEAAMQRQLADNPQGKHGKHVYSLEEYGLTKEAVRRRFGDYIDAYRIPLNN